MRTAGSHIVSSDPYDLGLTQSPPNQSIVNVYPATGSVGLPLTGSFLTPTFDMEHEYGLSLTIAYGNPLSGSGPSSGSIDVQCSNQAGRRDYGDSIVPAMTVSGSSGAQQFNAQHVSDWVTLGTVALSASYGSPTNTYAFNEGQVFFRNYRVRYNHAGGMPTLDMWSFLKGNRQ